MKLINTVFERRATLKSLNGKRLKFDSLNPVEECHGDEGLPGLMGGLKNMKTEKKNFRILTNCLTYSGGRLS